MCTYVMLCQVALHCLVLIISVPSLTLCCSVHLTIKDLNIHSNPTENSLCIRISVTSHALLSLPLSTGNGIAALHSVPTAIFCVLHCLEVREGLPENYRGMERTMAYSLALGGDTDPMACMAGASAGAHYGVDAVPHAWRRCCEGAEDADRSAEHLHKLYHRPPPEGDAGTRGNADDQSHASTQPPSAE